MMDWYAVQRGDKPTTCAALTICTPYWTGAHVLILYPKRTMKISHCESITRHEAGVISKVPTSSESTTVQRCVRTFS